MFGLSQMIAELPLSCTPLVKPVATEEDVEETEEAIEEETDEATEELDFTEDELEPGPVTVALLLAVS